MRRSEPIAVFAYAFAHHKTQDFLVELGAAGYVNVTVIAAPWKALPHSDSSRYFPTTLNRASPLPTPTLCAALGFSYHELDHDNTIRIAELRDAADFKLGIIAGARIITGAVIDLFEEGILNIHPGKLPETAGLDLFFYTIVKGVEVGVTAHYIDSRVDAGDELFFEETALGPDDSIEVVQSNNYQSQIRALRRFVCDRDAQVLTRTPVVRPKKNPLMSPEEKRRAVEAFTFWRSAQFQMQRARSLFTACSAGDCATIEILLEAFPDLIEFRSPEGWTPLIVAAHASKRDAVAVLLARGSDPNACGRNGTTVLMYAKTALIGHDKPDLSILRALLNAGADPLRHDAFGKDVYYYLRAEGDRVISNWLASQKVSG